MNLVMMKICKRLTCIILSFLLTKCTSPVQQNNQSVKDKKPNYEKGTYGYDLAFFESRNIKTVELKDEQSKACVLLVPAYQGRVMTSSADGNSGASFGWINHQLIGSGKVNPIFNPFGGEERLWLGPEGGPFSIYFRKGKEQVFANWIVPKEIDTTPYDVILQTSSKVTFKKEFELTNASGTSLKMGVCRTVKLLTKTEAEQTLPVSLNDSLHFVGYESENELTNKGQSAWTHKTGFLSIWLLSMFNPSEKGVVFIPFKEGSEVELGKKVTDDYFGKVPSDRLIVKNRILFFKTDGKFRSKIGISPERALSWCGSYDPLNHVLTLLWYSKPGGRVRYVNSRWGHQDDPLKGDVVNSYNDGPVADGSILGPFYEIESSSPAALLAPNQKIIHRQRIFHISGNEAQLSSITEKLFGISIQEIKNAYLR